jgi:hypothetical protein
MALVRIPMKEIASVAVLDVIRVVVNLQDKCGGGFQVSVQVGQGPARMVMVRGREKLSQDIR